MLKLALKTLAFITVPIWILPATIGVIIYVFWLTSSELVDWGYAKARKLANKQRAEKKT